MLYPNERYVVPVANYIVGIAPTTFTFGGPLS